MKRILLFLVSYALVKLLSARAIDIEQLNDKLRQSKKEFIKIHIQETSPVQEKSYKVHWDRSWRVPLTSKQQPFTISMLDGIFILDGNRVMAPSLNGISSNETLVLREIDRIGEDRVVKFIESIIWRNTTTYLLACYELGQCSLYTGTRNSSLRFRHTIAHRGVPVDAEFFTRSGRLFLVIANNADKFSVPSVIYRWSGTYMDVVGEVMTIGAESVTTFEYRQSTIIVFAQSDVENPWIGSEVYEFKNNNIARIQFLSTARPTSVHHYVHGDFNFVLIVNELQSSSVLCWDGRELLDWFSLSEIKPRSLISTFHMDGDTFVVVAYDNIIRLYKFHSTSDWKSEDVKHFKDDQKIIDMTVSLNERTMTFILIIKEQDEYWVEQWETEMMSVSSDSIVGDADITRKCLSDLIEILQARMPAIKKAETSWKLLPPIKNVTTSESVRFDNLILQSGIVESIEITAEEEDILPPHQIQQTLDELERDIDDVLSEWQNMMSIILSNVRKIITDKTHLDEFEHNQKHMNFTNDTNMQSEEVILPEGEQQFAGPLYAKSVIVHDLEVDSLCGIPFRYWTLRNNTANMLVAANGPIKYSNDIVIVQSDLAVQNLTTKRLNGIDIHQLIDNLFVVNRTQKIKGQVTYRNSLKVKYLSSQTLNDVPADKLLTTATNQSFDNFFARILEIDQLYAETINGVPVEKAARKSRENVIKGKVNLAKLHVTENFIIDVNASLVKISQEKPLQIYENVTITGDLYLRNAKVGKTTAFIIGDVSVNVKEIFNNYWTKSSDQTISGEIVFKSGLTIDRLDVKYLNSFAESDFLYTTMEEIPSEFTNLHFENFHVAESFVEEGRNVTFFNINSSLITIWEKLHLRSLHAKDIFTLSFNGIKVDDIMAGSRVNFSGTAKLSAVQARHVLADNLDLHLLNDRKVRFENGSRAGLRIDNNYQMPTLKVPEFHARNLRLEKVNGTEMRPLMGDLTSADLNRIVVDGDLTVENLTVERVDNQSIESFLEELARKDIVITEKKSIDDLNVQNITLQSLHGRNFDDLIANVVTRSREQILSKSFSARVIVADNVTTNFINSKNVSQLMWVDEPLTITGNVTFTDLHIEGDVITPKMNGREVRELYDNLLIVPARDIDLLMVENGGVFWEVPSTSSTSVSYLLENAVTKDTHQFIRGSVTFEKDVRAWTVTATFDEVDKIRDILSDVVIDDGQPIEISEQKLFEDDLIADRLTVKNDLGIVVINDVNITEFNDSIVRKDCEDVIVAPLIFDQEVKIYQLRTNNADLKASIDVAARTDSVLPSNVVFENLEVLGNVLLKNLDGINFDEFVRNRVTLRGNHNVSCDMKFNGLITVTGNANIGKINGIRTSDLVLSDADSLQIISGTKTFKQELIIKGNVTAPRINDIDIVNEYAESARNDEDIDIDGDLVFKEDVWVGETNISEIMNMHSVISDFKEKANETLRVLEKYKSLIEQNINYSSQVSGILANVFFYLEAEESLTISGFNITRVDVLNSEEVTKLNMYSEQPGSHCGLPDNCPCSYQSVVKLSDDIMQVEQRDSGEIMRSFRDSDGIFTIHMRTNVVTSSKECTSTKKEFTTVTLTKFDDYERTLLSVDVSDEVKGYWKDAKIFKYHGDIYMVLVVYYNTVEATHRANSLLYRVHMMSNTRKFQKIQEIPTDGAWSALILEIDQNVFLFIGCLGKSKSPLYRFDPVAQKFKQLRIIGSKSRYMQSLSRGKDHFVLLDNPDTNAVNIYKYDTMSHDFYSYQSIFHDRQINGIERFYAGDSDNSDAFVIVTTEGGQFYIYEYMFVGKFRMKLQHSVEGLRMMVPFQYMNNCYIFAGTYGDSMIFRIVRQGPQQFNKC